MYFKRSSWKGLLSAVLLVFASPSFYSCAFKSDFPILGKKEVIQNNQKTENETIVRGEYSVEKISVPQREFLEIWGEFFNSWTDCPRDLSNDMPIDTKCYNKPSFRAIKKFKEFIKKYPDSDLVDDAELRIAHIYGEFLIPKRAEYKKYLTSVIENHPLEKTRSIKISNPTFDEEETIFVFDDQNLPEKSAAMALYYRATCFNSNRECDVSREDKKRDLLRIISGYSDSPKAFDLAARELEGMAN